jgi:Putative zinc-finger
MECKETELWIADFIDGHLNDEQRKAVADHLHSCANCRQLQQEYEIVLKSFHAGSKEVVPVEKMNSAFFEMLKQEKELVSRKKMSLIYPIFLKYAAAACVFIAFGVWLGRSFLADQSAENQMVVLQNEIQETKKLVMLSMLKQNSASERIKAVSYADQMPKAQKEIVDALIHTFLYDETVNVRLAAAQALAKFGQEKAVRLAFIRSLKIETDAIVQITVIEIVSSLHDTDAVNALQNLSKNDSLPEIVRQKALESIGTLL